MRRVVVTGMGAACSLGLTVPTFWERLCAGASGITPITRFDATGLRNTHAGEVKPLEALLLPPGPAPEDPATRFALAAARASQKPGRRNSSCVASGQVQQAHRQILQSEGQIVHLPATLRSHHIPTFRSAPINVRRRSLSIASTVIKRGKPV